MKTKGILNNELAQLVATMGHGDMLVITDRGFPFPRHDYTTCIDLSVGRDLPRVVDVLRSCSKSWRSRAASSPTRPRP